MKKLLLCWAALLLSFNLYAQSCTEVQPLTLFALQTAIADGHKDPRLLVGIIKIESDAGNGQGYRVVKQGSGKQASTFYGASQLTLGAAKEVMSKFPELWAGFNTKTDEELKAKLILDDQFNVRVASKYLLIMGVNRNPDKGVAAYNLGLGAVELVDYHTHKYTLKVKQAAR